MMQNLSLQRFMEDVDTLQQIFPSLFEHRYKALKNSTPGKVAYIWQIEQSK